MNKLLTILIPVYNHYRYTMSCVASILKSDCPKEMYEILVVDNASTDKTETFLTYLQECGEPIRIIQEKTNLGFLLGVNDGWKEVETPFCLLLSNDVVVEPDTITLMLQVFQKDSSIGIVGGIQVDGVNTKHYFHTYFYRGNDVDKNEDIVYVKPLTEEEKQMEYVEVESTGFACAIVKKEVWEKIGFLDERFVPCMAEQDDYFLRTKEAGFKIVIHPKALYFHTVGATTANNKTYFDSIVKRNKLLFKEKWGEKLRRNEI